MPSRRRVLTAALASPLLALPATGMSSAGARSDRVHDAAADPGSTAAIEPPTGRWRRCADLPWAVQEVYGTARDGLAIVAGGMVVDATGASKAIDRTGLYDPVADRWTEGPRLPAPRHHPLLVGAGGRVYAFGSATHGGGGGHWQQRRDVFALDREGGWFPVASMPATQSEGIALAHEGRIHIVGGRTARSEDASRWDEQRDIDWHRVYDIAGDTWTDAAPLPSPRNSATAGVIDGHLYVAGGRTMDGGNIDRLDRYDPVADRWQALRPMPHAAGGLAGGVIGGRLYALGGEQLGVEGADGVVAAVVRYDPMTDRWQRLADMPTPRHGLATVVVGTTLYAIGGGAHTATGRTTAVVEALSFEPT